MSELTRPPASAAARRRAGAHRDAESRLGWFFAGPAVLLMLTFLVAPLVLAFALSFTNAHLISPKGPEFTGTANFGRLLTVRFLTVEPIRDASGALVLGTDGQPTYPAVRSFTRNNPDHPDLAGLQELTAVPVGQDRLEILAGDPVFIRSLINTIVFALIVVPLQGAFGLLLALVINQRTRGVNLFRTIYFVPVVMSMVVISILWKIMYDGQHGLVNTILGTVTFGLVKPIDWLGNPSTSLLAVMIMSIWQGVGFHMIIWLSGLQTIPGQLYEAAALDGAGRVDQFKHVTWPGLRNTSIFVLITITIAAFGLFTQIDVMTRGGPLDSTTTVIYQAVLNGFRAQDIGYGSAITVVFFAMVLVVTLIQRRLTRKYA
jgi:multiple sugar transport system permease protein